jgi:hypothetical protein
MSTRITVQKCGRSNIQTISRLRKVVVAVLDLGVSLTNFFVFCLKAFAVRID